MDKAILVAVDDSNIVDFEYKIDELKQLMNACNMEVCATSIQRLNRINSATYIGSGKLEEINVLVDMYNIDYVVFMSDLSPAQLKNIVDIIDCVVLDRTNLILKIFESRAGSREAKLQVEAANLQYMLPRLIGMRKSLGRQGGTSGSMSNRGQGEKQLELDRRHIEKRISELNKELQSIEHDRNIQRRARLKSNIPSVALVGYTNAGKSSLMNCLLRRAELPEEKIVFEKDMLFATLDTSVRKIDTGDNKGFILSDTVGFVSDLPHTLIKAFRTTLSEAAMADLLLIILDSSDTHVVEQREITEKTLKEINCNEVPRLYVYNKCDLSNLPVGIKGLIASAN